jgi:hypothetical protein
MRRESRSIAEDWAGPWSKAVQVLEGHKGYEAYALVPFKAPGWRPGLYMGLAAFFSAHMLLLVLLLLLLRMYLYLYLYLCLRMYQLSCQQLLSSGT